MPSVVTANALRTGEVVYLADTETGSGQWTPALGAATVAATAEALLRLEALALAAVQRAEVTSVYALDVRIVDGRPEPVSVRETIRAARAPTV